MSWAPPRCARAATRAGRPATERIALVRTPVREPGSGSGRRAQHHQPDLGHVFHRPADAFPTEAGALAPAIRHVVDTPRGHVSDHHAAHLELVPGALRVIQVTRKHARLQAELAVVD